MAYEFGISDWSSEVCSSVLCAPRSILPEILLVATRGLSDHGGECLDETRGIRPSAPDRRVGDGSAVAAMVQGVMDAQDYAPAVRSEVRRVGNECVFTGRSRWATSHYKKNTIKKLNNS